MHANELLTAFLELQATIRAAMKQEVRSFSQNVCSDVAMEILNVRMDTILIFTVVSLVILQFGVDVNSRHESN